MPEKFVFVISTGRTGTKALAEFFNSSFDNVVAYHQPPFSRIVNIATNLHVCGKLSEDSFFRLVSRLKKKKIEGAPEHMYIEVNSLNYGASKVLRDLFKNTIIIHIVRDPRTFVRSYLNWIHTRRRSFIANRLTPFWQPSGFLTGEVEKKQWDDFEEFEKIAWHWSFKNRVIERMHEGYRGYLQLRFEDIFSKNKVRDSLHSILAFIDLPYREELVAFFDSKRNVSKKQYCPPFSEWPEERRRRLFEICGPLMHKYGYEIKHD